MSTCSTPRERLFQYAVWYRDPKDAKDDVLISEVATVKALDRSHVERIAIRGLAEEWTSKLANIVVDVKDF